MNDFTKEELQIIQWEINTAVNKLDMATLSSEKHSELNEKIKSMIDNYCEHEWHSGGNRPWLHCIKCKSNFKHEPCLY